MSSSSSSSRIQVRPRRRRAPQTSIANNRTLNLALSSRSGLNDKVVRVLSGSGTVSSSGGGIINNLFSLNPSGFSDWSTIAALYDEWRMVGVQIQLYSAIPLNSAALPAPLIMVFDNDDNSTVLTSVNQDLDYTPKIQFNSIWTSGKPVRLRANKLSTGDPSTGTLWVTTATPSASPCSIKFYGGSLTATTLYLTATFSLVLEFRSAV